MLLQLVNWYWFFPISLKLLFGDLGTCWTEMIWLPSWCTKALTLISSCQLTVVCYLFWIELMINKMHGNTWILGLGYIFENCHFRWLKLQTSYCKTYWAHLRPPSLLDSWIRHNPSWKNKFVVFNPAFPLLQLQPNEFPQIPHRIFWCFILPTSKFQKAGWVCLKLGYPGILDSNGFAM